MKKFGLILAVILGLVFVGVAYVYVNIDNLAKGLIEDVGSQQLGVPVRISDLNVDVVQKQAGLNNLTIGNPADFSSKHAFGVASISTRLGKISRDLIVIEDITVGDIDVLLEVANKTTNLQTIQGNLPKAGKTQSPVQAPDVIIEKITIGKTSLEPKIKNFDGNIGTLTVPGFTLRNIGTAENGVTIGEAIRQIMAPYLKKLEREAIQGQLMKKLPEEFRNLEGKVTDKVKQLETDAKSQVSDKIQEQSDKVRQKADEIDKKIGDKLDGLLQQ